MVYFAWNCKQIVHTLCKEAAILGDFFIFYSLNPGKAGHGVTFDISCMKIKKYGIFMSWDDKYTHTVQRSCHNGKICGSLRMQVKGLPLTLAGCKFLSTEYL